MGSCPRTVRNFWIEAEIDGRKSRPAGGPRGKEGGMSLTLYQRSGGSVALALEVSCIAQCDGVLVVKVEPSLPYDFTRHNGKLYIKTKR